MRRISYLAVLAVAALGVTAYASLQHSDPLMLESTGLAVALAQLQTVFITAGPVLESAELDGDTLTISFDDNIELSTVDLSKLHVRERGYSTGGLSLDAVGVDLASAGQYKLLFDKNQGTFTTTFTQPSDIALDAGGQIIVTETGNEGAGNIHILGPRGGAQISFGSGLGDTLSWPRSVAVNATGHVWVADTAANYVRIFHQNGTLLPTSFGDGTRDNGIEQLDEPEGIAINGTGHVYVADTDNNRIQVLSPSGEHLRTLNFTDSDDNDVLDKPSGIAVNATGHLFVSDTGNDVIRIFDWDGGNMRTLNVTDDALDMPRAIAIGPEGRLFVADTNKHRIAVLDHDGNLLDTIGTMGTGDVQFENPRGVEVGPDGRVYVADTGNDRIQVLSQADTEITLNLDADALRTITGLSDPVLDIDQGAVSAATDGEPIAPSIDNPLVTPDSSPPGLEFDTAALDPLGRLSILFNGEIATNTADLSGLHVRERGASSGGVMLSGGPDTTPSDERFSYIGNLTAADLTHVSDVTFTSLSGLTVDSAGRIFVADASDNSTIWIFNPDGTTESFMSDGDAGLDRTTTGLTFARDVAVGPEGRIFATDTNDHLIQVFERTRDGKYEHAYNLGNTSESHNSGTSATVNQEPGLINKPLGVEVDSTGHVFTAESLGRRVQVFEPGSQDISAPLYLAGAGQGNTLQSLLTFGPGEVETASGITLDNAGRIIVTSVYNHKVFILSQHATLLHDFGSEGNGTGQFDGPRGPAVDAAGNIFIADTNNHRIQAFDKYGNYLGMAGAKDSAGDPISGNGTLEFKEPRGIAVDNEGRILVSDTGNKRIQILSFTDVTERDAPSIGSTYGTMALDLGGVLNDPSGIATDSNDRLIVADSANHCVRIFNTDGTNSTIGTCGTSGLANDKLNFPRGVAVNGDDHIFVADTDNCRVQVFNQNGGLERTLGRPTSDSNKCSNSHKGFLAPRGVAFDNEDRILVVDSGHRALIFDSNAVRDTFAVKEIADTSTNIPVSSSLPDGFISPQGIASNGTHIFVADNGNHRISVFDRNGDPVVRFGLKNANGDPIAGSGNAEFRSPHGVAIDSSGRIIVADTGNHRIKIHGPDGSFVGMFGSEGNGTGQFKNPRGVWVDGAGNIWVADTGNDRIQLMLVSDVLSFDLSAAAMTEVNSMTRPVLNIAAGALTGQYGTPVPAVRDGEILKLLYAGPPAIREVTVAPGHGTTVGYGGSLYVTFKSEPGLILHSNSTINGKPIKSDMMTYSGGTYTIEHTVSQGDPNVADNEALLAEITVLDVARNTATVVADGISADSAPAIDSSRATVTLEGLFDSGKRTVSLEFSAPVNASAVTSEPQIRDGAGMIIGSLSPGNATLTERSDDVFTLAGKIGLPNEASGDYRSTDGLSRPYGVAVNGSGHIWVADRGNDVVKIFNSSGMHVNTIGNGTDGGNNDLFNIVSDLVINSTGHVFVSDTEENVILAFDGTGAYEHTINFTGNDSLNKPLGLAVDGADRLYVADSSKNRILVVGPDGSILERFGNTTADGVPISGVGPGAFADPQAVVVGPDGRIYVSEFESNRVQILGPDGSHIDFIGGVDGTIGSDSSSNEPGGFAQPGGMAIDGLGRLFVADSTRVQMFSLDGVYLGVINATGDPTGSDALNNPRDVAIDRTGRVLVADTSNNRIVTLEPSYASGFAFRLSDAADAMARAAAGGSYLDVPFGIRDADDTNLAMPYEIPLYVPAPPPPPSDPDTRPRVAVTVPDAQDRSLVGSRGGGSSGIIIDNTIVQSPGEATSVLHSINWETSNDMITLYIVTSAPAGSEPYVYLRTPDSGTVTAKVSDSQPYPGRILYEAEISASNSFAQVYVDGVSRHILLDAPDGNVQVTLYDGPDMTTSPATTAEPVITEPDPVIEPETPVEPEPVEPVIQDDIPDTQDVEPVQVAVDPEPTTNNEQIPDDDINGCLIATAAYGTELAPQVQLLREIRDGSLLQTHSGTAFMGAFNNIYYAFSPEIADLQRENPVFREATKLLLTPMLYTLNIMSMADDEASVLGLGLSVIALNIGMYLAAPAFAGYAVYKHRKNFQ